MNNKELFKVGDIVRVNKRGAFYGAKLGECAIVIETVKSTHYSSVKLNRVIKYFNGESNHWTDTCLDKIPDTKLARILYYK